jgi:hypothetical protein
MANWTIALWTLGLEALLFNFLKQYITEKNPTMIIIVVVTITTLFAVANLEEAKTDITHHARYSQLAAWTAFLTVCVIVGLQFKFSTNDVTQTFLAWNKMTGNLLLISLFVGLFSLLLIKRV